MAAKDKKSKVAKTAKTAVSDYDKSEITDRERKAAKRQIGIAEANVGNVLDDYSRQSKIYDISNQQNKKIRDVQKKQGQRKHYGDRYRSLRDLADAAYGLAGSMGPTAFSGSTGMNFMDMLRSRNDRDNTTFWDAVQANNDDVYNEYIKSENQNMLAQLGAAADVDKTLGDIANDTSTNLNNINPNLYKSPSKVKDDIGANAGYFNEYNKARKQSGLGNAVMSGYVMPDNAAQRALRTSPRNRLRGNDYFSKLVNRHYGY